MLVTGAAGFIGFHTSAALARNTSTAFVIGIDNFNSYYNVSLKLARERELMRLQESEALAPVAVVHGDINDAGR